MDSLAEQTNNGVPRFSGLQISGKRFLIYSVYCAALACCYFIASDMLPDSTQTTALALAFTVGAVVPCCALFRRDLDLLEPIYWFSAMYFAFFLGAVYFILTDFQYAQHNLIDDPAARNRALVTALWLVLLGYVVFLCGYLIATMDQQRARIEFRRDNQVSNSLVGSAICALLLLGLLNFTYLVTNYPGGLLGYYSEMGLRAHRLDAYGDGVTTAGLQLIYAAVWLWLYTLMRAFRQGNAVSNIHIAAFLTVMIGSAAILASQGRLFQTVSYCLALAGMAYAFSASPRRNTAMLFGGAGLVVAGLGLFFGRLLSLLIYNRPEVFTSLGWSGVTQTFFRTLGRFVLDGGNVTDLTSLMNIIAFWERDFSYLYGTSFLSPVSRLVAGVDIQSIAELTQPRWSTGVGAWPPTFLGELFANFGIVGVIGGMLVAGFLIGRIYTYLARRPGYWTTLVLCALTFRFFFILPKGEIVNLVGAIWLVFPAVLTFGVLQIIVFGARRPD